MTTTALLRTPLFDAHLALGGRMVGFAGWAMPIQYGSILEEHRAVRSRAGMFDVSHMGRLNIGGADAAAFLQHNIVSDVRRIQPGRGQYSVICTENGGILDDIILYQLGEERFHLVCNASNREAVVNVLQDSRRSFQNTSFEDVTLATGMIALQGPEAARHLAELGDDGPHLARSLESFDCAEAAIAGIDDLRSAFDRLRTNRNERTNGNDGFPTLVARTGYTGEDGFEIIAAAQEIPTLWERLRGQGVVPCGLGARDTLRLEAALPLHGHDISLDTTPLEAGLGWVVHLDKGGFVGYDRLRLQQAAGLDRRLICFEMTERGIPRAECPVLHNGHQVGLVTSGGPAPSLGKNIGMGYVPASLAKPGTELAIDIRGTRIVAKVVRRPFYRRPN